MRKVLKFAGKCVCALGMTAVVVSLSGCFLFSWMTSKKVINPPAPLVEFKATQTPRTLWKVSLPKSGVYEFSPALAGDSIYAAAADGTIIRVNAISGQTVWRIDAKMKLTAGVGNLVDADVAKESANLTALQTKQQLGIQALSIANSSKSGLLSLFR